MNKPKRSLGQNFLINTGIAESICNKLTFIFSDVDYIIEIGPGRGALTKPLLNLKIPIIAIEKDNILVRDLKTSLKNDNLSIICGDGSKIDLDCIEGINRYKNPVLTGNLPYNMASKIIQNGLHHIPPLTGLFIMVQREMAERICASPKTKDYGAFSVLCQSVIETKILFNLSPSSFNPKPKVTSSLIAMVPHKKPLVDKKHLDPWWLFLRRAFTNRRKFVKKVLTSWYYAESIKSAWLEIGLRDNERTEEMNVQTIYNLFFILKGLEK